MFGLSGAAIGGIAMGVGAVGGAIISSNASKNAANAQAGAANNANQTQWNMYQQNTGNLAPYNKTGQAATSALAGYYGLPGGTTPGGGFASHLASLPGYQFQFDQGNLALQHNLAASGLLKSGAAVKESQQYGQGLASQYGQTYAAGLQGLGAQGESAAAQTGYLGANTANQIGSNQIYAGNAQAYGIGGQANAINAGLSGLASSYGQYANRQPPPIYGYPTSSGN